MYTAGARGGGDGMALKCGKSEKGEKCGLGGKSNTDRQKRNILFIYLKTANIQNTQRVHQQQGAQLHSGYHISSFIDDKSVIVRRIQISGTKSLFL